MVATPEWVALAKDVDVGQVVQSPQAPFGAVKVKIGNIVHNIELGSKKSVVRDRAGIGLLGSG
jgi:U6 snRNA phosphodiesterase